MEKTKGVKKMEKDNEIKDMTKIFHDRFSKEYGIGYRWQSKDFGQMKKLLTYLKSNKTGFEIESFREIVDKYFEDPSSFIIERKHPFTSLCTNAVKYLAKRQQKKPVIIAETPKFEHKTADIDLRSAFMEWAVKEPIKAVKGFCKTNGLLKRMNPQRWKEIGADLKDLVGVETFKKHWIEREEIEVDAPNP